MGSSCIQTGACYSHCPSYPRPLLPPSPAPAWIRPQIAAPVPRQAWKGLHGSTLPKMHTPQEFSFSCVLGAAVGGSRMGWVDLVAEIGWCWHESLPSPTRAPEAAPEPSNTKWINKIDTYVVYVNIVLTCIQNEGVTWSLLICPISTLCFVFACKKKQLFLIFVYIWCNQIPPPLKLISCCWAHPSYYWVFIFPWASLFLITLCWCYVTMLSLHLL